MCLILYINLQAAVFNCVATVDEIFDKNGWYYVSCPNCKKSASAAETHFKCEFCHESVDYPITRYSSFYS
jgi:Zn finger protein HypA/HybF involved in hydrogenase expression